MTDINKPRLVSLFSGCGGMDLGFEQAGYEIVWANDIEESFPNQIYQLKLACKANYHGETFYDLLKSEMLASKCSVVFSEKPTPNMHFI